MRRLISTTPFLIIVIPLIAGIVCAEHYRVSPMLLAFAVSVCVMVALVTINHSRSTTYIYALATTFCIGMGVATVIPPSIKSAPPDIPIAAEAQQIAVERLGRLSLHPDNRSLVEAMSIGYKIELDNVLKRQYGRVGVAHILAVSGLHVGMVFILINILLLLLPAFVRHGHLWKNTLAIILIWCYALVSGASPSVMRAALMFSFGQVAIAMTRTRSPLNIILAAATIMLIISPSYLYDIGFQLSYAATIAIIVLFRHLYAPLRSSNRFANAITQTILITLVASLGTAPLVAYYFGSLPLVGLAANIPVIIIAHVIVLTALLWIVCPINALNPIFSAILDYSATAQNRIVELFANHPHSAFDITLSTIDVFICYGLLIVIGMTLSAQKTLSLHR